MKVVINGTERELEEGATARDAARLVGAEPSARGVAVAIDGEVVPRSAIEATELADGQRVEVVAAIQGG